MPPSLVSYKPRITHDVFTFSPFSSDQMMGLGNFIVETKIARIQSGKNSNDNNSKPLTPRYAKRKVQHGRAPIRDWTWRGKTLRSMKVKRASESEVVIGFVDDEANKIASNLNMKEKMFDASPNDMVAMEAYLREMLQQHRVVSVHAKIA